MGYFHCLLGFFSLLWFLYFAHGNCKHGYNFLKGPLKTFYFNDACNLFLFSKSNTKISIFSEIKTQLILIGLHLCFICLAYLSSVSFLFSWISSTFPCYLLKYCIRHKLLPRLRQSSSCCCPLTGHRQLLDLTSLLLTACDISILIQLKTAALPKFTPSLLVLGWGDAFQPFLKSLCSREEDGRREGGEGEERASPGTSHSLEKPPSLWCLCGEPKAGRYFTKAGKGKGIWTSSKQLSLKTTDGNREIWGSTSSQWHCERSLHNMCSALHISASPLSTC